MEILVKELIAKHKLNKKEATEAIKLVTDYLKSKNPDLKKLIEHYLNDQEANSE